MTPQAGSIVRMVFLCLFLGGCAGGGYEKAMYPEQAQGGADPTVESRIHWQFAGNPVMIAIAKCESGMRQWETNGSPLRGRQHRPDTGVFQINKAAHAGRARKLGLDLDTFEGNVAYASMLYETEGTTPWVSSRPCWRRQLAQRY